MKFLIDNSLSPRLSIGLEMAGYDSIHVCQVGLEAATDRTIFDWAWREDRVVVAADTDFGTLLAQRQTNKPSVILFRRGTQHRSNRQLELLLTNLDSLRTQLDRGSIVVIEQRRIRVRPLPIARL